MREGLRENPILKNTVQTFFKKERGIFLENKKYFKNNLKIKKKSRRISLEVKKIFFSCHLIFFILDVRNPLGTWPSFLYQKEKYKNKKIFLVLNKCDLVPFWVMEKWVKILSHKFLVFGFFCKKNNANGKNKILGILRQIKKKFFAGRKKIFAGVVGYPNVGKSSFINTLVGKKCLHESPVPGQTKIWQFVKLTKEVFIIDSPGIISEEEELFKEFNVLKGIYRIDKLGEIDPAIQTIMLKIIGKIEEKNLNLKTLKNPIYREFLKQKYCLKKGGEKNAQISNNKIIKSFLSGNLPWFAPIPSKIDDNNSFIKNLYWKYFDF